MSADRPSRRFDELVEVGQGQHLGQALLWWGGRFRRAAWFGLEPLDVVVP